MARNDPLLPGESSDDTVRRPLASNQRAGGIFGNRPEGPQGRSARGPAREVLDDPLDFDAGGNDMADFGERSGGMTPGPARPSRRSENAAGKAFEIAGLNPVVTAAAPLLWLAGRLNESTPPENVRLFRDHILSEIQQFESAALARGISNRTVRVVRYALSATIDDIILNTSWGGRSNWSMQGLVSSLYNETWGGERFFDLLNQLSLAPDDNIDALELMAICLSIGFSGKYRVMEGGQTLLNRQRHELYRAIRRVRGPAERDLSAGWEVIAAPNRAPASLVWLWVLLGAFLFLLAVLYMLATWSLSERTDQAVARLRDLVPNVPVPVQPPPVRQIVAPTPTAQPKLSLNQVQRISAILSGDITAKRAVVVGTDKTVTIRLLSASFPAGGTSLVDTGTEVVQHIAQALDKEPGPILVTGYTDNQPVSAQSAFKDNVALSLARAKSAAAVLQRSLSDPKRVSTQGRGDADAIALNDSFENRAQNRRVEFQIPAETAPK